MRYLLDTNILSSLVRMPEGLVARRMREVGEARVYTSVIVAAELRFGVARKGSERLSQQIGELLGLIRVEPMKVPYDRIYADLRVRLERAGTPIGGNDLFIAAHALADGSILVSDNTREFERISGLVVENWLRP